MPFKMSLNAKTYYGYQRCKTRSMSHAEVEAYAEEFHGHIYEQFRPYLPEYRPGSMALDIGCGIGAIDIFIARHYQTIVLMDGTVSPDRLPQTYYGFHGRGYRVEKDADEVVYDPALESEYCIYNDLNVSVDFVQSNLSEPRNVIGITPSEITNLGDQSMDLVQSHMSWGWHYPIQDVYLEDVKRILRPGGLLVIDIRDGYLRPEDLSGFVELDRLPNREPNSKKFILERT